MPCCLEEPEFWARGGWEENFKREWKTYYKEDWLAPNSSPDAQYRASKLKSYLYRRVLSQIFDFAKIDVGTDGYIRFSAFPRRRTTWGPAPRCVERARLRHSPLYLDNHRETEYGLGMRLL